MPESTSKHSLVKRIKDEFYKDWSDERRNKVEPTWLECYAAFRGDYSSGVLSKWLKSEGEGWRSKVFVRLTKMKVVSGVSQVVDPYFQGGMIPYGLSPTPVPEDMMGQLLQPADAESRARKMKDKIDDILVQCKMRKLQETSILERAIYGVSVLKAPIIRSKSVPRYRYVVPGLEQFPELANYPEIVDQYGRYVMQIEDHVSPGVEHPSIWDMFWDMEGESFQEGQGVIQRLWATPGMVRRLYEGNPQRYDKAAIERVISKANVKKDQNSSSSMDNDTPNRSEMMKTKRNILVLEFAGRVNVSDLKDTELGKAYDTTDDGKEVEILVTIADDEIIARPIENPLVNQTRPFFEAFWETIPHESTGVGVAENIRDSQMMTNSAVRLFVDNKALSGNVIMAGNPRNLAPGQSRSLYPGKFFELAEHVLDARMGLQFYNPPDVGNGLLDLVNMFERYADMEANLPNVTEGRGAKWDPKTAFGIDQLMQAANKAIGKTIENEDTGHTEPIVECFYHFLMATHPDQAIKGDYTCKATGVSTYNDRMLDANNLQSMMMFMMSNQLLTLYLNPYPALEEIARKRGIDPDRILIGNDQVEARAQALSGMLNPPQPTPGQFGGGPA